MSKTARKQPKKNNPDPYVHIDLRKSTKAEFIKMLNEENAKRKCAKIVYEDVIKRLLKKATKEMFDEIELEKKTPANKEDEVFEAFKKTHRNATKSDYKAFQYNHPMEWAKFAASVGKVA